MRFSTLLRITLLVTALCATAHAQGTLSFPYNNGNSAAASGSGQSFVPGDAGTFPTANAYLTQMTFNTGDALVNIGAVTYLDIYTNYSPGSLSGYVGSSTNSQSWDAGGTLLTKTFNFDNLALDKNTTYYAAFSSDNVAGGLVVRSIEYDGFNPYSDGGLIYSGTLYPNLDANFSATFASAVPEPSAYAAMAGLGALGLAVLRRRRAVA